MSHGYVYKKRLRGDPIAVGKRLLCANRRGRGGCGSTLVLYVAHCLPRRHHGAAVLQNFVFALQGGASVAAAWCLASGAQSPRHGWRWLSRLHGGLVRLRALLPGPDAHDPAACAGRTPRLGLLLPTLAALIARLGQAFVAAFALQQQCALLI